MERWKHTRQEHVLTLFWLRTQRGDKPRKANEFAGSQFGVIAHILGGVSSDVGAGHRSPHITAAAPSHPCARSWGQKKNRNVANGRCGCFSAGTFPHSSTCFCHALSRIRRPRKEHVVPCVPLPISNPKVLVHTTLFCREKKTFANLPGDREAWRILSKGEHVWVELADATVFAAGEQIKGIWALHFPMGPACRRAIQGPLHRAMWLPFCTSLPPAVFIKFKWPEPTRTDIDSCAVWVGYA